MSNLQSVVGDYNAFLKQLLHELTAEGFDLSDFVQMDHMCYRVPSLERYELKKQELSTVGKILGEAQINGRPITVFRLRDPVFYEGWRVDAVELPAPKQGVATAEGLEHVEFVLFDDIESFVSKYASKQFEMKAAERGVNPEIGYRLPSFGVKFHLINLPTAVYLEQKLGLLNISDEQ